MRILKIAIILLSTCSSLWAQLRLSEVLYNEPDNRTRLEWIEIYNPEPMSIPLSNYQLVVNADTFEFSSGESINSQSFIVICRQLVSSDGSDSFEGHWGDSSGFWGDYALENYEVYVCDFSLPNVAGSIELIETGGAFIDSFAWNSGGVDGISFERESYDPGEDKWHLCTSWYGSTPGHTNSVAIDTGEFDLRAEPRIISISRGETMILTATSPIGSSFTIEIFDDLGFRVRNFDNQTESFTLFFSWNGADNDNHLVRPGIYIILLSASGNDNITKAIPVVVAP